MRDRVRWYHQALREVACWLLGHWWKTSWRRRADYAERVVLDRQSQLSYREQHEGNPYCEYSAGWHYKCRRCRLRTRDDRWEPWYRGLWWGLRASVRHAWWTVQFHITDRWKRPAEETYHLLAPRYWPVVFVHAALVGIAQFLLPWWLDRRWPVAWLGALMLDAHDAVVGWLDDRLITMRWVPPRADVPGEIGYHIDARLYNADNPMRITRLSNECADTAMNAFLITGSGASTVSWTGSHP